MKYLIFLNLCLLSHFLFAIINPDSLKVQKEISYTTDLAGNLRGGRERGFAYISQLKGGISLSIDYKNKWGKGYFYSDFMIIRGKSFSSLSGDIQIVSNIEAPDMATVFEIYYKHNIKNFSFLAGLLDVNAHFLFTDHSLDLINSSFGIQPTLSVNIPVSIFPLTAPGVIYKMRFSDYFSISGGFFDGMPGNYNSNTIFPDFEINKNEGIFSIAEGAFRVGSKNPVQIKLGAWIHTGNFESHISGTHSKNYGLYMIADRKITGDSGKELYGWLKTGTAPLNCNIIKYFNGAGLTLYNPFSLNREDYFSCAVGNAIFCSYLDESLGSNSHETVLELTLKKQLGPAFLQPDIQYIINPSGIADMENSLCGILRFGVTF